MIERFYLKEFLTFKEAELDFHPGLVVFTGPSGSGKSILLRSILASVGLESVEAQLCESSVSWQLDEERFGIGNEPVNVFRQIKKEKTRYFINNQSTSKASMESISSSYLRHLSLKDYSDFEPHSLLRRVDEYIIAGDPGHTARLARYRDLYSQYKTTTDALRSIEEKEKQLSELKEFAAFEIAKIDNVKPRIGEDEELSLIKKQLSKKEKIEHAIRNAEAVFNHEPQVHAALALLDIDPSFFDDAMNELRHRFESSMDRLEELEDVSVEEVLDRIEQLSELKRRYGGIEEAIAYRDQKARELESYETIEHSKSDLVKKLAFLTEEVERTAQEISSRRRDALVPLRERLNHYLKMLYLRDVTLELEECDLDMMGRDRPVLGLQGTKLDKLSSGEFNRLRLALLAVGVENMQHSGGVLMLDEIDANLSGEESMSVARVLRHLSTRYQIFVISHQPQLTSMGEQHFLVYKEGESRVRELNEPERISEIARIISGDAVSGEAIEFARDLFERSKGIAR